MLGARIEGDERFGHNPRFDIDEPRFGRLARPFRRSCLAVLERIISSSPVPIPMRERRRSEGEKGEMMHTILKSATKEVVIGIDRPFVMIGEKINPTGRKKLAAALSEGNLDYVRQLAENQVAWGADVLDINVGVPGIDEIAVVKQIVELVASVVDVPLCLDSANRRCSPPVWPPRRANRWSTRSAGRRRSWRRSCRWSRNAVRLSSA